jgi:hypothetical protein
MEEFLLSGIESLVLRRRLRLEAEQQRLGLLEARLEMQSKRIGWEEYYAGRLRRAIWSDCC